MSGHLGEQLSALLDGELSEGDRAAAQVHLRECPVCAHQLEELAAVDALARDVPVEAPEGYFDELPGRVRTRLRERRKPRMAPAAVWVAAAAAVVMIAVVTPRVLRERAVPAPVVAPATLQNLPAPAGAAPPPATPVPSLTRAADALSNVSASVESDRRADKTKADETSKPPLAKTAPARIAPATAAEEAELRRSRDDTRPSAAGRGAEAAPAETASVAGVATHDYAAAPPPAAPPAAPQAAPAPSTRGAVASMQEQKQEDAPEGDRAGAARPTDEARKEAASGRRLRGDERYEILMARRPATAAEARDVARAWEGFTRDLPADRHADEARVRAVESWTTAWRLGRDAEDLARARAAARSYLDRGYPRQTARVRALLDSLPPSP